MSEKQPKKKKTAGDVVLTVVLIAAICVFCYAGYNLFHIYTEYKKGTDEYNNLVQMAVTEKEPDAAPEKPAVPMPAMVFAEDKASKPHAAPAMQFFGKGGLKSSRTRTS